MLSLTKSLERERERDCRKLWTLYEEFIAYSLISYLIHSVFVSLSLIYSYCFTVEDLLHQSNSVSVLPFDRVRSRLSSLVSETDICEWKNNATDSISPKANRWWNNSPALWREEERSLVTDTWALSLLSWDLITSHFLWNGMRMCWIECPSIFSSSSSMINRLFTVANQSFDSCWSAVSNEDISLARVNMFASCTHNGHWPSTSVFFIFPVWLMKEQIMLCKLITHMSAMTSCSLSLPLLGAGDHRRITSW